MKQVLPAVSAALREKGIRAQSHRAAEKPGQEVFVLIVGVKLTDRLIEDLIKLLYLFHPAVHLLQAVL
jgi:hypothetical protein